MTPHQPEPQRLNEHSFADRIDLVCDAFEHAWIAGESPRLEAHLEQLSRNDRDALFPELLKVEIEYRRHRGETIDPTAYESRFPDFAEEIRDVLRGRPDEPKQSGIVERDPSNVETVITATPSGAPESAGDGNTLFETEESPEHPKDAGEFCSRLEESRLLDDEALKGVRKLVAANSHSAEAVAGWLVREQLLTDWQARALLSGRTSFFLGRYRLLDQLGRGGMGLVFKAVHARLRRPVALKVMSRRLVGDPAAVARFRREISAAAALNHPNIIHAYDADCVDETHFLVMEYVDGEDLSAHARRVGSLPVSVACDYIRQAALGLQHAHERGLVHRDIKPSNMLLVQKTSTNGGGGISRESRAMDGVAEIKILDFGLARYTSELSADGGITSKDQMMGTPDYVAPEQAQDVTQADIRSDIYSLGCTLFRLLTGRSPFAGANPMQVLMARVLTDAPRVRSLRDDVPPELDAVIATMLERDPNRRYQTPRDVAAVLRPFCQPNAVAETPAPSPMVGVTDLDLPSDFSRTLDEESTSPVLRKYGSRIKRDRRQYRWLLAGLGAFVVLVAISGFWRVSGKATLVIDWPLDEREGATLEVDGRDRELTSDRELRFTNRPGKRTLRFTRDGYVAIEATLQLDRGEELVFRPKWVPTAETQRHQETAKLAAARLKEWTPVKANAERTIASAKTQRWDAERAEVGSALKKLIAFREKFPYSPQAREAGSLLTKLPSPFDALKTDDKSQFIQLSDNLELAAVLGDSRLKCWKLVQEIAVSPDGSFVAAGTAFHNGVALWDAKTGVPVRFFPEASYAVAFHPDNTIFAYTSIDYNRPVVVLFDLKTRRELRRIGSTDRIQWIQFSPTGDRLLLGEYRNPDLARDKINLQIIETKTGKLLHNLIGHEGTVITAAWSPDGTRVASSSGEGTWKLWRVDGPRVSSIDVPDNAAYFAFSPDGKLVAAARNELKVWDIAGEIPKLVPKFTRTKIAGVVWHPAGKQLAVGGHDGSISIIRRSDAKTVRTFKAHHSLVHLLVVDREGKSLWSVAYRGHLKKWDFATGKELLPSPGPAGPVRSVGVSMDGRWISSATEYSHHFSRWKLTRGAPTFEDREQLDIVAVKHGPHGRTLATSGPDGTIRLRHTAGRVITLAGKGVPSHSFESSFDAPMAFSPDGKTMAVGAAKNILALFDTATGQLIKTLGNHQDKITAVCFSPDGTQAAAGTHDGEIAVWNIADGSEVIRYRTPSYIVYATAFLPDGKKLLTAGLGTQPHGGLIVWNVQRKDEPHVLAGGTHASDVEVSLDGRLMASIHYSGKAAIVRLWRLPGLFDLGEFRIGPEYANRTTVFDIAIAPDGRHILTANSNGTVFVVRIRHTKRLP